ncbi:hypothetical protein RFI_20738 [Reticulomyxa filosa]|uniref:Uncharacterized protein n=1 Tax=Reticulomyxa filosa TaxID=46433 RepID=X6MSD9_RETFI|nr:hypothetical protein RFI_20738 [Reticulomyxa filosa]|eukprot:ETO16601.1 hypothetical protein RFI_20738 [Reticulomyxa filosa]
MSCNPDKKPEIELLSAKLLEERQHWENVKKCMNEIVSLVHNAILAKNANKPTIVEKHTATRVDKLTHFEKLLSGLSEESKTKNSTAITEAKALAEELAKDLSQQELGELNLRIGRFTSQIERIRTALLQEYKQQKKNEENQ